MGEMKSAFERAWERAERLGSLTEEEMEKEREKELLPIGKSLSESFLSHGDMRLIDEALDKYGEKDKRVIEKGFLLSLLELVDPEGDDYEKAIYGFMLRRGDRREELERLRSLVEEFRAEREKLLEKLREEIEEEGREMLHQLRISGSAISGFNPRRSEVYRRAYSSLVEAYRKEIEGLKERIREGI